MRDLIRVNARELRRAGTPGESKLWSLLRDRRLDGWRFRRQHPHASFVLDFYCPEARLAVELDGGQHADDDAIQRDAARTRALEKHGIRVLRFWNDQALRETDTVLELIAAALKERKERLLETPQLERTLTPSPLPEGEGIANAGFLDVAHAAGASVADTKDTHVAAAKGTSVADRKDTQVADTKRSVADAKGTIAIVDYGIGNLGSVIKAFRHVGARTVLTSDPAVLDEADALVLPGDGAFGATMDEVRRRDLVAPLMHAAERGTPLLGICIGMQLLFEESEEHGRHEGLGLLPGSVRRFDGPLPVPHMGWNRLHRRQAHPLLDGLEDGAHVYFVHSYYCDGPDDVVIASSDYGRDFAAVVGRGNVLGVQFHPEKSQAVGLAMVANFVRHVVEEGVRRQRASAPTAP